MYSFVRKIIRVRTQNRCWLNVVSSLHGYMLFLSSILYIMYPIIYPAFRFADFYPIIRITNCYAQWHVPADSLCFFSPLCCVPASPGADTSPGPGPVTHTLPMYFGPWKSAKDQPSAPVPHAETPSPSLFSAFCRRAPSSNHPYSNSFPIPQQT